MGAKFLICDSTDYAGHQYGRADAIQPRVLEIWQSLGIPFEQAEHVAKKVSGRAFWELGDNSSRRIASARLLPRSYDYEKNYSLLLRQGLVEQILINDAQRHDPTFKVQWDTAFVDMKRESDDLYTISLKCSTGDQAQEVNATHTIRAKYVIAADGARSAVRRWAKPLDVVLQGDLHPITWCVLDAVGVRSNHPDLERVCINRSKRGIVLVIPREPINGKPSCRFDIQIENKSKIEAKMEDAIRMIKEIFHPFTVEWDEVNWWSSYDVSQRLINKYSANNDSIFFLGDCCHTHSPRTGLGLNTAIMEAHNLCWKLAYVAKGLADHKTLATYASERYTVAEKLINIDRTLVAMYAGLEKQSVADVDLASEKAAEWLERLHKYQLTYAAYQAGASIAYSPSVVAFGAKIDTDCDVTRPGVTVGARLKPAFATRVSDMVTAPILARFDGRFSIFVLAGDLEADGAFDRLTALDDYITSTGSIFEKYTGNAGCAPRSVCEPLYLSANGASDAIPPGRVLYTHDYNDVPQITGAYHAPRHGLFRVAVATTADSTSDIIMHRLAPKLHLLMAPEHKSQLFAPLNFFCDDEPVLSPYRESFPEGGDVLEHPLHGKWGVGPEGAIIVGRPDGHVGMFAKGCTVKAWKEVEAYFAGFLEAEQA
ncbi:FAD binding domain-containing protein [Schizophyllum fasciatum]